MNRIAMQSLWMQPGLFPFASGFTKRGSIIDTGVDYGHADMIGMNSQLQVDQIALGKVQRGWQYV
jgi:hypothetical protein